MPTTKYRRPFPITDELTKFLKNSFGFSEGFIQRAAEGKPVPLLALRNYYNITPVDAPNRDEFHSMLVHHEIDRDGNPRTAIIVVKLEDPVPTKDRAFFNPISATPEEWGRAAAELNLPVHTLKLASQGNRDSLLKLSIFYAGAPKGYFTSDFVKEILAHWDQSAPANNEVVVPKPEQEIQPVSPTGPRTPEQTEMYTRLANLTGFSMGTLRKVSQGFDGTGVASTRRALGSLAISDPELNAFAQDLCMAYDTVRHDLAKTFLGMAPDGPNAATGDDTKAEFEKLTNITETHSPFRNVIPQLARTLRVSKTVIQDAADGQPEALSVLSQAHADAATGYPFESLVVDLLREHSPVALPGRQGSFPDLLPGGYKPLSAEEHALATKRLDMKTPGPNDDASQMILDERRAATVAWESKLTGNPFLDYPLTKKLAEYLGIDATTILKVRDGNPNFSSLVKSLGDHQLPRLKTDTQNTDLFTFLESILKQWHRQNDDAEPNHEVEDRTIAVELGLPIVTVQNARHGRALAQQTMRTRIENKGEVYFPMRSVAEQISGFDSSVPPSSRLQEAPTDHLAYMDDFPGVGLRANEDGLPTVPGKAHFTTIGSPDDPISSFHVTAPQSVLISIQHAGKTYEVNYNHHVNTQSIGNAIAGFVSRLRNEGQAEAPFPTLKEGN